MLVDRKDILKSSADVIDSFLKLSSQGNKLLMFPDGSSSASFSGEAFYSFMRHSGTSGVMQKMLLDAIKISERTGPGSHSFLLKCAKNCINDINLLMLKSLAIDEINDASINADEAMMHSVLHDVMNNQQMCDIVLEALKLAGAESKIFVEQSHTGVTYIEQTSGYTFECMTDAFFLSDGIWKASDVKVLVIDGIVENVSEIDTMLSRAHEQSRAVIIFARGFSNDVLNTLRTNFSRQTLNVMPVVINIDEENINMLNDIAYTACSDVVSSLKGDLISSVKFDDIASVDRIKCTGKTLTIENYNASAVVQRHVNELIKKRRETTNDAYRHRLDKRIRSLTAASVMIKIACSTALDQEHKMHSVGEGLRIAKAIMRFGCVTPEAFDTLKNAKLLLDEIKFTAPTISLINGIHGGCSTASDIHSVELAILRDV